ncbi:uncharacterized protein FYW47_000445 [Aplochiton taeniatus]
MSVTMTKGGGVTVLTIASNPKSSWPPLCQILGALCYSPVCCSVSQRIRKFQGSSLSALGTLQIMTGLLNIGLGAIVMGFTQVLFWFNIPYLLGSLFIVFGILCILAEKFPSRCLVGINVLMNLAGVALAITGIVMYAIDLADQQLYWMCRGDDDSYYRGYNRRYGFETTTAFNEQKAIERESYLEKCMEGKQMLLMIVRGLEGVLIILAVLQLCVNISSAILGIKALVKAKEDMKHPEDYKPLLEEVTCKPTA